MIKIKKRLLLMRVDQAGKLAKVEKDVHMRRDRTIPTIEAEVTTEGSATIEETSAEEKETAIVEEEAMAVSTAEEAEATGRTAEVDTITTIELREGKTLTSSKSKEAMLLKITTST